MGARGPLRLAPSVATPDAQPVEETLATRMPPGAPKRPANMSRRAVPMWNELVEALDEAGMLSKVDGLALDLAIRHYLAARDASQEVFSHGATVPDGVHGGQPKKNPATQVFRDNSTMFLEYAKQLGLTFVARHRVVTAAEGEATDGPFG